MHEDHTKSGSAQILTAVLVLLAVAVHGSSLFDALTNWDDAYLVGNPAFVGPRTFRSIFWPIELGHWMPTTQLVLAVVGASGAGVFGLRLVHLALIVAAVLLVARIAGRLSEDGPAAGRSAFVAAAAGAALAVHPLVVEPVAWAIGTKDLLATTFALAALDAWLPLLDRAARQDGDRRRLVGGAVALLLAIGSKASVLAMPAAFLLLALVRARVWRVPLVGASVATGVVAGGAAVFARVAQARLGVLQGGGVVENLLLAAELAPRNALRVLAPTELHAYYTRPEVLPSSLAVGSVLLTILVAAAVGLAWKAPRRPGVVIAAWALAAYLPVSGVPGSLVRVEADSYLLLVVPAMAWGVSRLVDVLLHLRDGAYRLLATAALVILGGIFATAVTMSLNQHRTWRDAESLWSHARAAEPESVDVCLIWASAPVKQHGVVPTRAGWLTFVDRVLDCEDLVWAEMESGGRSLPEYRALVRGRLRRPDVPEDVRACVGGTWPGMVACLDALAAESGHGGVHPGDGSGDAAHSAEPPTP